MPSMVIGIGFPPLFKCVDREQHGGCKPWLSDLWNDCVSFHVTCADKAMHVSPGRQRQPATHPGTIQPFADASRLCEAATCQSD